MRATIERYAMIRRGEKVLVAVSGGPDSMALLHGLHELEFPLEIAHLDHQTRAGESGVDAEFVSQCAKELGLAFHHESRAVEQEAAAAGRSFEFHARNLRYAFFLRVARERACAVIATGHHLDDRAETVLMRILRGTGPAGLAGIPPVRAQDGLRIVRPLFELTRAEIEAWLRERRISWRQDESNTDPRHPRNRIRHGLLPVLEREHNPRVREALLRLAEAQRCDNAMLDALAGPALAGCRNEQGSLDRAAFRALHESLRRRCVMQIAHERDIDIPFDRVIGASHFVATACTGQYFDLGAGVLLYNGRTRTEVMSGPPAFGGEPVLLPVPGEAVAMGQRFTARLIAMPAEADWRSYCTPRRQVFDADVAGDRLELRSWRDGDRFTPFGMTGSTKLQDYFVNVGLPAPWRRGVPLIVSRGEVLWITGHAIAARGAVTPATRRLLEIEVTPCT